MEIEIREIKNSEGKGENRKFVCVRNQHANTEKELVEEISRSCTLTRGDIMATYCATSDVGAEMLGESGCFYLPEIGHFKVSLKNDLPDGSSVEDAKAPHFSVRNISFRPDKKFLQKVALKAKFSKSRYSSLSQSYTEKEMLDIVKQEVDKNSYVNTRILHLEYGLSNYMARKWLTYFVEKGILNKTGVQRSPIYVLAK